MSASTSSWLDAPTYWAPLKDKRLSDLQCDAILGTGTRGQRASLLIQLESERRTFLDAATEMARLRNACAPVSALPAELLVHVASFVANDKPVRWRISGEGSDIEEQRSTGWTAMTRVSNRWRVICQGAPQLWQHSLPPLTDNTSLRSYEYESPSKICFPYLLPGLQKLSLVGLTDLYLDDTFNLLGRSPQLESLRISKCSWLDPTDLRLSLPMLNMQKLASLKFDTSFPQPGGYDHTLFEIIYEHLRFPRHITIDLSPRFTLGDIESGRAIRILRRLFVQTFEEFDSSGLMTQTSLSLGDQDGGKQLCFSIVPANDVASTNCISSQYIRRATINIRSPPLYVVFADPCILTFVKTTSRLVMVADSTSRSAEERQTLHRTLFRTFPHIRVLHVATLAYTGHLSGGETAREFLGRCLASDVANRFPCLEELRLPYGTSSSVKRQVIQLLKDRIGHPGNAIKTLRLAEPRPSGTGEEEAVASELEGVVPVVIWASHD